MRRLFLAICRINLKKGKSCQINSWQVWAQRKITIISCFTHLRRSALQPSPQCTATVLAVHCIRSRKYLHPFPQVLATIPASTCNRPCKYLQENTPSFRMTISSPMFFLLTRTSAMFIGQNQKRLSRILLRNSLACASGWA